MRKLVDFLLKMIGLLIVITLIGLLIYKIKNLDNPQKVASNQKEAFFSNFRHALKRSPLASEESFHVEYPTVYNTATEKVMLYSAFGEDRRWRIKLAIENGNDNWIKYGSIFSEKQLSFQGNYAFPHVIKTDTDYVLFFAASQNNQENYTQLWKSVSQDGTQWNAPVKVLEDIEILDPVVTKINGKEIILYTSADSVIKMTTQEDNTYSEPKVIWQSQDGIYTIGSFNMPDFPVFVVEISPGSHTLWVAKCLDKNNRLVDAAERPLLKVPNQGKKWDSLKYGPYFYTNPDKRITLYCNGIKGRGAEKGGQVAVANVDMALLLNSIIKDKCYKFS